MKQLCTAALALLLLPATGAQAAHKKKVKIADVRATQLPDADAQHHKYHDVAIYRALLDNTDGGKRPCYEMYFYGHKDDSLFCFMAGVAPNGDYATAMYAWENDTLVNVTFKGKKHSDKKSYQVFGYWRNGMKTVGVTQE